MCSERWQSDYGWDPKCTMGDMTWLAVLLLFALSFSSLLWSVLACSPEWRDTVMLTPGFLDISVCLCNKDWLIPWCFVNRAVPCWHGPYLSCSGEHGPNSVLSPGSLVTSWWTTIQTVKEDLIMQLYTLIMVMFFTINRAWTRQTGMGQFQCWYLLYVSNEKC